MALSGSARPRPFIETLALRWCTPRGLLAAGLAMALPYGVAWFYQDLRVHTVPFLGAFFAAFVLYALATLIALRLPDLSRAQLAGVFGVAILLNGVLWLTPPTLSDDMYRYVWDGRVQAQGLSPYRYAPGDPVLAPLRDEVVWPRINRKGAVTVYPPAAEAAFALLWRMVPDSVRAFQIAMSLGALASGLLLVGLLRSLGQSTARVVLFLWSPLLIFETAHSAHVEGLVLPLLAGAWWARVRGKDALVGVLLGLATATKLYPALLLPALWRPGERGGRWTMPLTFGLTVALAYLPYLLQSGSGVFGYLPSYFEERFNLGAIGALILLLEALGANSHAGVLWLTALTFGAMALAAIQNPADGGREALRRSLWFIVAFTLLSQNLHAWYMLWALPLLALFLEPSARWGLRPTAYAGLWLFCGAIGLSYTFYIDGRHVVAAVVAQHALLILFLLFEAWRRASRGRWSAPVAGGVTPD